MPILSVTSLLFTEVAFSATATSNPFQNSEKAPNSNLARGLFPRLPLSPRRVELGLSVALPAASAAPPPPVGRRERRGRNVGRSGVWANN